MGLSEQVYLELYTAAIRGWLMNDHALQGSAASTAEYAHTLADHIATRGSFAIANVGQNISPVIPDLDRLNMENGK